MQQAYIFLHAIKHNNFLMIYSLLSGCCTAWGTITRLLLVGPTKVKARKSFLFTEKFQCIENKEYRYNMLKS